MSQENLAGSEAYVQDPDNEVSYRHPTESERVARDWQFTSDRKEEEEVVVIPSISSHRPSAAQGEQQVSPGTAMIKKICWTRLCKNEIPQLETIDSIKNIFGVENVPLDTAIDVAIVPRCVWYLKNDNNQELQYAAACILTNISAGDTEKCRIVANSGALEQFARILKAPRNLSIIKQAIWTIGNLIGDGPELRDLVILKGTVPPMIDIVKNLDDLTCRKVATWALVNLCRYVNAPTSRFIKKLCLSAFGRLLKEYELEIFGYACKGLLVLSDGPQEWVNDVFATLTICPRLLELLGCKYEQVLIPTLTILGNMLRGSISQKQYFINNELLPLLVKHLTSKDKRVVFFAVRVVAILARGSEMQIFRIIDEGMLPLLVDVIRSGEPFAQKYAVMALGNITCRKNFVHAKLIWNLDGAIAALCSVLSSNNWKATIIALDVLQNLFDTAAKINESKKLAKIIEDCGGWDLIQNFVPSVDEFMACKLAFLFLENNRTLFLKAYLMNLPNPEATQFGDVETTSASTAYSG